MYSFLLAEDSEGFQYTGALFMSQPVIIEKDFHQTASVKSVTNVTFTQYLLCAWYIPNVFNLILFGMSWHLSLVEVFCLFVCFVL